MSETTEKVLDYLGEKPRKVAFVVPASGSKERKAAAPAHGKLHKLPKKSVRTKVVTGTKPAMAVSGGRSAFRPYRASALSAHAPGRLAAKLDVDVVRLLNVAAISERTYQRRQADKKPFLEEESDRLMRVARVSQEAERVFRSGAKASRWLSADNLILGASPLELLGSDDGAHDVEFELVRVEHGDFA